MNHIHAKIEILTEHEIEMIHRATLEVLRTVGCHLPHRRILERLAKSSAEVDYARGQVKLSPDFVENVMSSLSGGKRISSEDHFDIPAPRAGSVRFNPGNQANMIDYHATSRRQGTTEDVIKGLVLCNQLPYIGSAMPVVTPADVPAYMADLYGYYLCALYSQKPYGVYIISPTSAHAILRIADIMAKGEKAEVTYLLEPNGALSFDEFSLEMALMFADDGQKFDIGPMAMAGLDAPVTLAGTLVMQNAYNLIGNVIAYLWNIPGSWSGGAHTVDLRSLLCSFGSPNQTLIALAAIQISNWYGFETATNTALTDACVPDFQGGFEEGMSAMATLLAGGAIGCQGIVGADQGFSLEQLVIDNEWGSAIDHIFSNGIEVNEDTLGVEVIQRHGILGNFLTDEHTIRHMRKTYWPAKIFNQESWDVWNAKGAKDVFTCAHEEVERILSRYYPPEPLVSDPVRRELESVIEEAKTHPELFQTDRFRYKE